MYIKQLLSRRNTLLAAAGAVPFVDVSAAAQAGPPQPLFYDVKQFGASGHKADKATKALQAAVDAAFAAGGGTVHVSPGEYTSGPVEIKTNVTVYLDAGATIFVSRDPADFSVDRSRPRALFYANDVQNIALTGRGRIDGQGTWEWRLPDPDSYTTRPIQAEVEIARQAGLDMRFWHKTGLLANIVRFNRATNVLIEGISTINSSEWCMRLEGCDRLFIRGVHLASDLEKAGNSDGIDLVSSKNVVISDCILETCDDCISLKTMRNGGPIENVTVTNCLLTSSSSAFVIGVETWADIHHINLSNCIIPNANRGVRIAVWNGCTVRDVIISNLTIDLNRGHYNRWGNAEAFQFMVWRETPDSPLGTIRNITVENIIARARGTSAVIGPPDQRRLEDIRISNFRTTMLPENKPDKRATHALRFEGVQGLRLRDCSVAWDEQNPEPKWGNGLYLKDVDDFEVVGFGGRQGLKNGKAAAIALENVTGGIVRNSRAAEGCGTFLEVRGDRTRNVSVFNNDTSRAASKYEFGAGARQEALTMRPPGD